MSYSPAIMVVDIFTAARNAKHDGKRFKDRWEEAITYISDENVIKLLLTLRDGHIYGNHEELEFLKEVVQPKADYWKHEYNVSRSVNRESAGNIEYRDNWDMYQLLVEHIENILHGVLFAQENRFYELFL